MIESSCQRQAGERTVVIAKLTKDSIVLVNARHSDVLGEALIDRLTFVKLR
jgi:hypothetical protein